MSKAITHVLDASALLCAILLEPGCERAGSVSKGAALSAVNYAEVIAKLIELGREPDDVVADLAILDVHVVPLDRDLAETAARLRPATRARSRIAWDNPRNPAPFLREIERGRVGLPTLPRLGLSLGDRCCLALALRHGAVAVTADRAWGRLDPALGIAVDLIR